MNDLKYNIAGTPTADQVAINEAFHEEEAEREALTPAAPIVAEMDVVPVIAKEEQEAPEQGEDDV